ncbi:RES family NAD+ phosphorylase [Acidisoma sp. 7E03]
MTHSLWRIAAETPAYAADDLSGRGANRCGGRWNPPGLPAVYASATRALACLETIVHLNAGGLPFNRYLIEIIVPDAVWQRARRETAETLAVGWDAQPAGRASISFGADWLRHGESALCLLPCALIAEEVNVLINPRHPDARMLRAVKRRRWLYDPRLRPAPAQPAV